MIIIDVEASGVFIDRPLRNTFRLNEEDDAVELSDGKVLKVKDLKPENLEQYIREKFINNTALRDRVTKLEITRGK